MKKCILFTAALSAALVVSCGTEPPEPPEEQFAEVWHTTNHYFEIEVVSVFPDFFTEEIKLIRERVSSVDVSESENYRLSFREDGTGKGSWSHPVTKSQSPFEFQWQSTDGELSLVGAWAFVKDDPHRSYNNNDPIVWVIESRETDRLVLSTSYDILCDGFIGDIDGIGWLEAVTFRYTFEKVK